MLSQEMQFQDLDTMSAIWQRSNEGGFLGFLADMNGKFWLVRFNFSHLYSQLSTK
jgi:hypothetical protein